MATDLLTTEEDIKNQDSCRISPDENGEEKESLDLNNLDGMDRRSLLTVVLLVVAIFAVLMLPAGDDPASELRKRRSGPQVVSVSSESLNKIEIARKLVINNNLDQAEIILKSLMSDIPYDGTAYMLMGDVLTRRNKPVLAMIEYRKGVDLNPDFLDRKTDVFQGKKIKILLNEVKIAIDDEMQSGSVDRDTVSQHKDILYYMLRKIAGSCG